MGRCAGKHVTERSRRVWGGGKDEVTARVKRRKAKCMDVFDLAVAFRQQQHDSGTLLGAGTQVNRGEYVYSAY